MIMGTEGGITTPIVPLAAIRLAAEAGSYPLRLSSGISVELTAAVVAAPAPEIAAKNIPASTETIDGPPRRKPNSASASATRRSLTCPFDMMSPTRMNIGMATRPRN
jgi:hypothetical protein